MSIAAYAEDLIAEATRPGEKSASVAAPSTHPVAALLKQAARDLRTIPDTEPVSLDAVQKLAMALQPGTGAQSPSAGAGAGSSMPAPSLPSLQPSNLGATAGSGGGGPSKVAAEIRKFASDLRAQGAAGDLANTLKVAHVLNAARALHHIREGLR